MLLKRDENNHHKSPNPKINVFLKVDHLCERPVLCPHDLAFPLWISCRLFSRSLRRPYVRHLASIYYICSGRVAFQHSESSVLHSTSIQGHVFTSPRFSLCLIIPLSIIPESVSLLQLRFSLLCLTTEGRRWRRAAGSCSVASNIDRVSLVFLPRVPERIAVCKS